MKHDVTSGCERESHRSPTVPERLALRGQLEVWRALAQETWPGVETDLARFEQAARAALEAGTPLDALHGNDLYLTCAALAGQAEAVVQVRALLEQELERALHRFRTPAENLDDLRQLVRTRVLLDDGERTCALRQYTGRGALRAFLRVAATRTCLNAVKREGSLARRSEPEDELVRALPSPLMDPELALLRESSRDHFRMAFAEATAQLSPRERTLLRQHFVDGVLPGELGPLYGVHRTTVLRWLQDASAALVRGTRRCLQARLHASPDEVDSLMRALGSQLDLSLAVHLAEGSSGQS